VEFNTLSLDEYRVFLDRAVNIDVLPCFITPTSVIGLVKLCKVFNVSEQMISSYIQAGMFAAAPEFANIIIPTYFDDYAIFCKVIFSKLIRGLITKNLGSTFVKYTQKRKSELDY